MVENKLITIIGNDDVKIEELVKRDDFLTVVNTNPPENWVKKHPTASNVKYLPIEKVELLLTKLFQEWHVEVKEAKSLFNALVVTVRLHYKDPISGWTWQEGVGAIAAQTAKGAAASDMNQITSDAVMKGLPAAESYAIKDAAEKIGKIFGKDLNRRDVLAFTASYGTPDVKDEIERKKQVIKDKLNADHTS